MYLNLRVVASIIAMMAAGASAAIEVRVVPAVSVVMPGQEYSVEIRIDGDTTIPGDQPVPNGGIQSAGVSIKFASANAHLADLSKIIIPAGLNSDGLGGNPTRRNSPGDVGYTGFIPIASPPYTDSLLATILLTNDASLGTYTLRPDFFFPLADQRENFIDARGIDIDPQITFAPAAVVSVLIPEPSAVVLCALAGLGLIARRRRA